MDEQPQQSEGSPSTSKSASSSGSPVGQLSSVPISSLARLISALPQLSAMGAAGWGLAVYMTCNERPVDWKIVGMFLLGPVALAVGAKAGDLVEAIRAWRSGR